MIRKILLPMILVVTIVLSVSNVASAKTKKLNILLLGDSYSAGNGAGSYFGPSVCYRSHNNWASILTRHLNRQGIKTSLNNKACSGATIKEMINGRTLGFSHSQNIKIKNLSKARAERYLEDHNPCKSSSIQEINDYRYKVLSVSPGLDQSSEVRYICYKHMKTQLSFIGPDTDVIMFSIGGNDLKFKPIVEQCFFWQNARKCRRLVSDAGESLGDIDDYLLKLLHKIRQKNSKAKIVILGYPLLSIKSVHNTGKPYILGNLVRELGSDGNSVLRQTINRFNANNNDSIIFIDNIPETFAGHEPHPSRFKSNRWSWIHDLAQPTPWNQDEWYHPNSKGHQAYANLLKDKFVLGSYAHEITPRSADIDMVFNIDTTCSMDDDIANVRQEIVNIINQTSQKTNSYRFAITTFSAHDPKVTPADKFARLEVGFTNDINLLQSTLDNVHTNGVSYESNYSGIMMGLNLPWRDGVHKSVVTLTDEPPENEQQHTGYNSQTVIQKAFAVDPAQLYFINTGPDSNKDYYQPIADATGGKYYKTSSSLVASMINQSIDEVIAKPHAWINGPYLVKTGNDLTIDAGGSYSPNGKIVKYEWDFNEDGEPDLTTTEPIITHNFTQDFYGTMGLIITDEAGVSNVATTPLIVSNDGDMIPPDQDNCPNHDNVDQLDSDNDGIGDVCDATHGNPWIEMYEKAKADYEKQIQAEIEQAKTKQATVQTKSEQPIIEPVKATLITQSETEQPIIKDKPTLQERTEVEPKTETKTKNKPTVKTKAKNNSSLKQVLINTGETNLYIILTIFAAVASYGTVKITSR